MQSPLKWHGGKYYLAKRIVSLMPPRKTPKSTFGYLHYVETHAGGLSVLFANDPEGISEVVNDVNKDLSNFWRVLQGGESFKEFQRLAEATPFSQPLWLDAEVEMLEWPCLPEETDVVRAWRFFIWCRMSLAGRLGSFAPLSRTRTRRGMNEQASAWLSAVEGLPEVHERLKRVVVLNDNATEVIRREDGAHALFYVDPPYLPETRTVMEVYEHEMTRDRHCELLKALLTRQGYVMLSGYDSEMYNDILKGWRKEVFDLPNNAAGGKEKRRMQECLWMNYNSEGR
jgi:DNA adenine methylase